MNPNVAIYDAIARSMLYSCAARRAGCNCCSRLSNSRLSASTKDISRCGSSSSTICLHNSFHVLLIMCTPFVFVSGCNHTSRGAHGMPTTKTWNTLAEVLPDGEFLRARAQIIPTSSPVELLENLLRYPNANKTKNLRCAMNFSAASNADD